MVNENLAPPSVAEMLRVTGGNTALFMEQVAAHVDKLEEAIVQLKNRIEELEGTQSDSNT